MGNNNQYEKATVEQINTYFSSDIFQFSHCVDHDKLKNVMGERAPYYVSRQLYLDEKWQSDQDKIKKFNNKQWKQMFRQGVPDHLKRPALMTIFQLKEKEADKKYKLIKEIAGDEFIEMTKESKLCQQKLNYDFLNTHGQEELEFILMYLNKKLDIKHAYNLVHVTSILLIYMPPAEVYFIIDKLIGATKDVVKSKQLDRLRWHVTLEKRAYMNLLANFMITYVKKTAKTDKKVLNHFQKIDFDPTRIIDETYRTLLSSLLPLDNTIEIVYMFIMEGNKLLYRFTYALLRLNRKFILDQNDTQALLPNLKQHSLNNTDFTNLKTKAFNYRLGAGKKLKLTKELCHKDQKNLRRFSVRPKNTGNNNPNSQQQGQNSDEDYDLNAYIELSNEGVLIDYLPNTPIRSNIIDYQQFAKIWIMLPAYVRIRIPQNIFRARVDGFNLQTLYNKCREYRDSYYMCLMFIHTTKNKKFGCFLDTVPIRAGNQFLGSTETMVFTIEPETKPYYFTEKNMRFMLCDVEYLTVGANGEGPAIRLDEQLRYGKTYQSETFNNKSLTGVEKQFSGENETTIVDRTEFEIYDLELYIV